MKKPVITFDKKTTDFILSALGYTVSAKGRITDKRTRKLARGLDDKPVYYHELAGFITTDAGPRLVRKDITDLLQLADMLEAK